MLRFGAFLVLVSFAKPAAADRLDEVLEHMRVAGDALETLSARFEQTDYDYILGDEEVSTGHLYVRVPGRIRWEYETPTPKVLLVKDDLVRLYNPAANQVQEFVQGKGRRSVGVDLLVGFGKSNEKIGKSYDATLVSESEDEVVLKLVPKPNAGAASLFTSIELTVDTSTWTPKRSVFHEPNRDRTDIEFFDVVVNGDLPERIFELDLPDNVEIVRN